MALDVLDIDFSGPTDLNGNLTINQVPSPAYWAKTKVVAQVNGAPIWVISVNQRAVAFGRGARVDLGPLLVQPKDQVQVQVIGAAAGSQLTGKLVGITGQLQDVITSFSPAPNTIALDVFAQAQVLKHITVGAAGTDNEVLMVPPGTQAIGWQMDALQGDGQGPSAVSITGHVSGDLIGSWAFPFSGQSLFAEPIVQTVDGTVSISVNARAGSACGIYVIAWATAPAPPLPATVPASNGAELLAVSEQLANPASWQKRAYDAIADSGDPAAGAVASASVAGVAGKQQTCGMIRAEIVAQVGVAATVVRFRLRDGASGAGAILQSWTLGIQAIAGDRVLLELSGLGFRGTVGNAMSCDFSAGVANAFETCGLGVWQD